MALKNLSNLLSGALGRKGLGVQLQAYETVKTADDVLSAFLTPAERRDVKALSYKGGVLVIACRHPIARHMLMGTLPAIELKMREEGVLAQISLQIRPEVWREEV